MRPLVRWPGGLENELEYIRPHLPGDIVNFYDPFVGSGAVYFATEAAGQYFVNDSCEALMEIYKAAKKGRRAMWHTLESACNAWKSVEAHIMGVQDDLLQLAFNYRHRWNKPYADFCLAVKEVMKKVWYSSLFTFVIPDPADFSMELRHQVMEALLLIAEKDLEDEDAVKEILTAMKAAVFYFMVEVYNKPTVDNGVKSGALVFTSHYSKQEGLSLERPVVPDGETEATAQYRPDFAGVDVNRVYLDEVLALRGDEAFAEKMSRSHIWNVSGKTFLQKNKIISEDFLFMAPQTGEDWVTAIQYIKSDRCDTRWMLVLPEFQEMGRLMEVKGVSAVDLSAGRKLVLLKNY